MRRKLDETRRSHRLKEQALRLQGSLLTGVAAAAAGGDVATAWKAAGGLVTAFALQVCKLLAKPFCLWSSVRRLALCKKANEAENPRMRISTISTFSTETARCVDEFNSLLLIDYSDSCAWLYSFHSSWPASSC